MIGCADPRILILVTKWRYKVSLVANMKVFNENLFEKSNIFIEISGINTRHEPNHFTKVCEMKCFRIPL